MPSVVKLDSNMQGNYHYEEERIRFVSLQEPGIRVSGLLGYKEDGSFDRLTGKYREILKGVNPALVVLGRETAGGQISFRSDTGSLWIRVELENTAELYHMTACGQCGFDCYVGRDRKDLLFLGVTRFDITKKSYQCELLSPDAIGAFNASRQGNCEGERPVNEFLINFPLYCHVVKVEIGIDRDASLTLPSPYEREGSLVLYGTSITQGACASRPGLCYAGILGRKLNLETYNFGFSGNGLGEPEVADLLAEIENPLLYLLDYAANAMVYDRLEPTLEHLIRRIRKAHPRTPVVVVSRIPDVFAFLDPVKGAEYERQFVFQRDMASRMQEELGQVYFIDGRKLFPKDCWELTVDALHPTDVGFASMAENMLGEIEKILG
ncbi:MAG: hypothetical protein HFI33_03425 [Lachnospiraceae bacterium]|nr:hypothetical protein [Lachnospiraceae bacterium]